MIDTLISIRMARSNETEGLGLFTRELMMSAHRLSEGLGVQVDQELAPRHG